MKTRVVRFHELGGPEVLRIETLDLAAPGALALICTLLYPLIIRARPPR